MAAKPTVGVLALQGDVREHIRALGELGANAIPIRRERELRGLNGLVLPGGESTTIVKLAGIFGLLEPVREAISAGLPTYGSCAGMILLAERILDGTADQQSFGGIDMTVRRNAFGRQVESFEGVVAMDGIGGGPLTAVFIRAPWVEHVGPKAQALAHVESGPASGRIVAVRQRNVLATSFHPELTGDNRVHEYFLGMVRDAAGSPGSEPAVPAGLSH